MRKILSLLLVSCAFSLSAIAQTDANIVGHVTSAKSGEHLPAANIVIQNTTIGVITDKTGHYFLKNLKEGSYTITASMIGFKTLSQQVDVKKGITLEVNFPLEEDVLNLSEVVVTSNRYSLERSLTPVVVSTMPAKLFERTHSVTLGEGINYITGLRFENKCQNCGFSQVRMNGMEGPYTQILINNHPIFSGLAGVYGLELIPQNMLEKVEVIRGGGSAIYGSNAIGGTVNLILKDPKENSFEAGYDLALVGEKSNPDNNLNFNTSLISDDFNAGMAIYGNVRDRQMYDANGDDFSEIAPLKNLVLGTRAFYKPTDKSKLSIDFFAIKEKRDGGNKQDLPLHERDVAEAVRHDMKNAAITYDQYIGKDLLSIYASGQYLVRDSYYGANQSLNSYGNSANKTYVLGGQYKANFSEVSSLVAGVENRGDYLLDKKLGYPVYDATGTPNHIPNVIVADQSIQTTGLFAQYELRINKFKALAGARFERYAINDDHSAGADKSGNVLTPRVSFMYDILENLQARLGYSRGYRAPQIFDEDLHVETSGAVQIINKNDPDLKQENSNSFNFSLDFNKKINNLYFKVLAEAFYTKLENPFSNSPGEPDANGTVIYTRMNAKDGAVVQGVNLECSLIPSSKVSLSAGITFQKSQYEAPQEKTDLKDFYRTPESYGFLTSDFKIIPNLGLAVSATYTGKMYIPYHLAEADFELRRSYPFLDAGFRLYYDVKIAKGVKTQFYTGMKNVFNSFQKDFDKGADRDPEYIYGPTLPRTLYFGIKFGTN